MKTNGTTDMGNSGRIGSEAGTKGKKHPKTAFHFPGKIILYEWCKLWLYQKIVTDEERLHELVPHQIIDFKLAILEEEIQATLQCIAER